MTKLAVVGTSDINMTAAATSGLPHGNSSGASVRTDGGDSRGKCETTATLGENGHVTLCSSFEDGSEMVEEVHARTKAILSRRTRERTMLGGFTTWTYELGAPKTHSEQALCSSSFESDFMRPREVREVCGGALVRMDIM